MSELNVQPAWWVTAYVLGELDAGELARMQAALEGNAALRAAVAEAQSSIEVARAALLADERAPRGAPSLWARHARLMLAAAAVLLVIGGGLAAGVAGGWFAEREDLVLIAPPRVSAPIRPSVVPGPEPVAAATSPSHGPAIESDEAAESFLVEGIAHLSGTLDHQTVRQYVRRYLSGIKWCYQQGLLTNPELGGKVTLAFTILPNGTTHEPRAADSTLGDAEVEQCMATKMARWRFPQPRDGGVVEVRYPIVLKGE